MKTEALENGAEKCIIYLRFLAFSVDNRRKRTKNYAFSYENALAWIGKQ